MQNNIKHYREKIKVVSKAGEEEVKTKPINQRAMAALIGINQSSLNGYETGRIVPSAGAIQKIIKGFEKGGLIVTFEELFPEEETND